MTDLTEQWKKRTLRNGAYYIKMLDGDILPAFCNTDYILKQFQTMKGIYDDIAEVLAPVPSYEEWQAKLEENAHLKEEVENCEFILKSRESEIVKLKELLRECLVHLTIGKYGTSVIPINILCDEVEEVLK